MRITLESTPQIVPLVDPTTGAEVPARIWRGNDDRGCPVTAFIVRIMVPTNQPDEVFTRIEAELQEQPRSYFDALVAKPRVVL